MGSLYTQTDKEDLLLQSGDRLALQEGLGAFLDVGLGEATTFHSEAFWFVRFTTTNINPHTHYYIHSTYEVNDPGPVGTSGFFVLSPDNNAYWETAFIRDGSGRGFATTVDLEIAHTKFSTNMEWQEGSTITSTKILNDKVTAFNNLTNKTDFNDGTLQGWITDDGSVELITDRSHSGSHSLFAPNISADTLAHWSPSELSGGKQITNFEFYYQETSNSNGGGIRLWDNNGNDVLGFATTNPRWNIHSFYGFETLRSSGQYDRWVYVKFFNFDWTRGQVEYFIEDQADGFILQGKTRLIRTTNVESIRWENFNDEAVGWRSSTNDVEMWIDDIGFSLPLQWTSPELDLNYVREYRTSKINYFNILENQAYNTYVLSDFESGQDGWVFDSPDVALKTNRALGTQSMGVESNSPGRQLATLAPSDFVGGKKIDEFSFWWIETSSSSGGGIRLYDDQGTVICGMASDNPEYELEDANGISQVGNGETYELWTKFEFRFNWLNGTFDWFIWRVNDRLFINGTGDLASTRGVEKFSWENYSSGWNNDPCYMWIDDVWYNMFESEYRFPHITLEGSKDGSTWTTLTKNTFDSLYSEGESLVGDSVQLRISDNKVDSSISSLDFYVASFYLADIGQGTGEGFGFTTNPQFANVGQGSGEGLQAQNDFSAIKTVSISQNTSTGFNADLSYGFAPIPTVSTAKTSRFKADRFPLILDIKFYDVGKFDVKALAKTDKDGNKYYYVASTSSTKPTAQQIINGQDASGNSVPSGSKNPD